jgi:hypothetical protein
MKALDLEAVQAFVLAADLKSFTRAAEALDRTQSSVSLKIKRLEVALAGVCPTALHARSSFPWTVMRF